MYYTVYMSKNTSCISCTYYIPIDNAVCLISAYCAQCEYCCIRWSQVRQLPWSTCGRGEAQGISRRKCDLQFRLTWWFCYDRQNNMNALYMYISMHVLCWLSRLTWVTDRMRHTMYTADCGKTRLKECDHLPLEYIAHIPVLLWHKHACTCTTHY